MTSVLIALLLITVCASVAAHVAPLLRERGVQQPELPPLLLPLAESIARGVEPAPQLRAADVEATEEDLDAAIAAVAPVAASGPIFPTEALAPAASVTLLTRVATLLTRVATPLTRAATTLTRAAPLTPAAPIASLASATPLASVTSVASTVEVSSAASVAAITSATSVTSVASTPPPPPLTLSTRATDPTTTVADPMTSLEEAEEDPATTETVHLVRGTEEAIQLLPARLEVVAGMPKEQEIRFVRTPGEPPHMILGRAPAASPHHVTLTSRTVSRQHARVAFTNGRWTVVNLSRTNPVVVNDRAMSGRRSERPLSDGDKIELGDVVLRFRAS